MTKNDGHVYQCILLCKQLITPHQKNAAEPKTFILLTETILQIINAHHACLQQIDKISMSCLSERLDNEQYCRTNITHIISIGSIANIVNITQIGVIFVICMAQKFHTMHTVIHKANMPTGLAYTNNIILSILFYLWL